MRIENSFDVPAPPQRAWALLLDVPQVVPCMPGAELTETVDESHWKATIAVRLGPMSMTFGADVTRDEVDETARRVVLSTKARELKGRGGATATIESSLAPAGDGTRVDVVTELQLPGPAAQFGGPVVKSVAGQLTQQFASCLQSKLAEAPGAPPAAPAPAPPVSGLAVLWHALLARVGR
jgi:carbon monoxide dehydrogenase subunit G